MGTKRKFSKIPKQQKPKANSILNIMEEGKEYASILKYDVSNIDIGNEMKLAIKEMASIRNIPTICYLSNISNKKLVSNNSISNDDDILFSELVESVDNKIKEIDIVLVTPGGSAQQVSRFVDKLRPRFDKVNFILPDMSMSAGTIFVMSGDEIIMNKNACIGPIDPQVPNKYGRFVPAQSILTLIKEIQKRGQVNIENGINPQWTDLQILNNIDPKEIGAAKVASEYSIKLVKTYLKDYKFRTWKKHSDGSDVTEEEKLHTANDIASKLCENAIWKSHGHGITREVAWKELKLKIKNSEDVKIDKILRKFWALVNWYFDNSNCYKIFISENYNVFRVSQVNS